MDNIRWVNNGLHKISLAPHDLFQWFMKNITEKAQP